MIIEQGEYKGNPLIVFKRTDDDKFPIKFGVRKCQVILQHIAEIKAFYEQNKQQEPNES